MGIRNKYKTYVLACLLMTLCQSCRRDHLYYATTGGNIVQLNIDWSKTAFSPESNDFDTDNQLNGVTVFAFDSDTHRFVTELPPDANWQTPQLRLPAGTYDLIVINDSREELPAIHFDTTQPFDDFSAYVESDTIYNTKYPNYLATSAVRGVSFVSGEKDYYYDMPDGYNRDYVSAEIATIQHAVTKKINIKVYVKGMNYCRGMRASYLSGLSRSVSLATRQSGREQAVYAFNLVNRKYRDATRTEAELTQTFDSFGFSEDNLNAGTRFKLELNFVLIDNTVHQVTTDVTPQFEEWLEKHRVDIGLDLDLDIDIALAIELPPVVEDPSDVGGVSVETLPWNDIIQEIIL